MGVVERGAVGNVDEWASAAEKDVSDNGRLIS